MMQAQGCAPSSYFVLPIKLDASKNRSMLSSTIIHAHLKGKRMSNAIQRCFIAGVLLSFAGNTSANDAAEKCTQITAPVDRLACYDKAFPPVVKGDVAAVGFGLSSKKEDKPEPVQVEAKITAISTMRDGKRLITLDNGQVWRETEAKPMVIVKKDTPVTVREAMLGTYMLVLSDTIALRVKRVK
jgi:hypothetical protein